MSDDNLRAAALLIVWVFFAVYTCFGPKYEDFDNGVEKGTNDTVIMCVENRQQCKDIYDYLKFREKLGGN